MASNVPITDGQGQSSVAAEQIGTLKYQIIKVVGAETGSTSVLGVNPDRSINVSVVGIPNVVIAGGSIAATFTPPANQSVSGTVQTDVRGSVAAVIIGGSIAASFTPPDNQSVSGAVTAPAGSIMQIFGSVQGVFSPPANQSVSGAITAPPGSVQAVRTDAASVIAVGTIVGSVVAIAPPGSVMAVRTDAASVITVALGSQSVSGATTAPPGSVQAVRTDAASVIVTGTVTTVNQSSSVIAVVTGSVVAIAGINSVIAVATNVGSVIAVLQAPSIVGTYAEDAAHGSADKGLFVMGVRNDLMASVTGADLDYSPFSTGPLGEVLTANAPITKWISGKADLRVVLGSSVQAIAAQGASVFTYITGVQFANMGPASVLVTMTGGLGSILAYTIAPAGGGSNIIYPNALKTGENSGFSASLSGTASVLMSAQGFIAKI